MSSRPADISRDRRRAAAPGVPPVLTDSTTVAITGPTAVAITGPTAVGKTAVAVALAKRVGGEIVSIDSRQVFRGLEICSNAPTEEELDGVPCHLVGVLDPRARLNAASYVAMAHEALRTVRGNGRVPILTAGTGLYLEALVEGFDLGGHAPDPALRAELEAQAAVTPGALVDRLAALDPDAAADLDVRNPRRLVRRLELAILRRGEDPEVPQHPPVPVRRYLLEAPRAQLYQWIEARVDRMLRRGWREEVAALVAAGVDPDSQALRSIGVAELAAELRGDMTSEAARDTIVRRTRNYAKRQLTWFRPRPADARFDVSALSVSDIVDSI